jgi:hypothetical protein
MQWLWLKSVAVGFLAVSRARLGEKKLREIGFKSPSESELLPVCSRLWGCRHSIIMPRLSVLKKISVPALPALKDYPHFLLGQKKVYLYAHCPSIP